VAFEHSLDFLQMKSMHSITIERIAGSLHDPAHQLCASHSFEGNAYRHCRDSADD
jgi:hypothetical protein